MKRILCVMIVVVSLSGCVERPPITVPVTGQRSVATVGEPAFPPRTPLAERPWTNDPDKFSFIILGDKTGGGEENWPIFDRAVRETNLLDPDFVIMVGDLVQGYTEDTTRLAAQWAEFWRHAGALRVPFLYLPGNHDVSNPVMLRWWKKTYGRTYYSFVYRECQFLVLNTDELRDGGRGSFGEEQVRWAIGELNRVRGARHTFVFLHKPAWQNRPEQHNTEEWKRIEAALGDRRYTVFAGHRHNLTLERRHGRRYFVLSATGAGLRASEVKQLGAFHHYTQVTVDGDSAHVAIIEPGSVWPPDIATDAFKNAASRLVKMQAHLPVALRAGESATGFVATVKNELPDTVAVTLALGGLAPDRWQLAEGSDSTVVVVPPGGTERADLRFITPTERLADRPSVRVETYYAGKKLYSWGGPVPIFPDSVMRTVREWETVGPFGAGKVYPDTTDPRAAMPWLYDVRGPENGWTDGAVYRDGNKERRWREARAEDDGWVALAPPFESSGASLSYALCGVWTPSEGTRYAALEVDDRAQVFVNGVASDSGRLYEAARGRPIFIPLPLRAGWNTVLLKVVNTGGSGGFALRIADGERVLRVSAHPE